MATTMRIAVTGATGNVGTALLRALADETAVDEIVGIARRRPQLEARKVSWVAADVAEDDLVPHLQGCDVVVHLAWLIQPSRSERTLWRTNVVGSGRVFEAAARAGVGAVVYASSIGAYSPGPADGHRVDESWPTHGVATCTYSRQKAYVERLLDAFEQAHPEIRVARLRPGLILQRSAGSEVRRLFFGPFVPNPLLRRHLIPVVPRLAGLALQAVHADDVADAYRLAIVADARGAYNVASEPTLDSAELARVLDARLVPLPNGLVRTLAGVAWRLRLQPTEPGWVDLALEAPVMDTSRVRTDLGWAPTCTSGEALLDVLGGVADGAGYGTPPLQATRGPGDRLDEVRSGVGASDGADQDLR